MRGKLFDNIYKHSLHRTYLYMSHAHTHTHTHIHLLVHIYSHTTHVPTHTSTYLHTQYPYTHTHTHLWNIIYTLILNPIPTIIPFMKYTYYSTVFPILIGPIQKPINRPPTIIIHMYVPIIQWPHLCPTPSKPHDTTCICIHTALITLNSILTHPPRINIYHVRSKYHQTPPPLRPKDYFFSTSPAFSGAINNLLEYQIVYK